MEKFGSGINIPDPQHWLKGGFRPKNSVWTIRTEDPDSHPSNYLMRIRNFETQIKIKKKMLLFRYRKDGSVVKI
jgi:hypothetical protein